MRGFFVLLRKEIKEQVRTSKILILAAVFLFFGLGTPLLIKYTPELIAAVGTGGAAIELPTPTSGQSLAEYTSTMSQMGVMVVVLMAMGAIAKEVESGTGAMVLSKPVGRLAFITAKLSAEVITLLLAIVLGGLACWGYTLLLFGDANAMGFLGQNLLMALFFVLCLCITLFFSSLMKRSLAAGGISIGVIIFLSAISGLPVIGRYLPGTLIAWGNRLALGMPGASEWGAVASVLALSVLCIYLSWAALRKKEL